MKYIALPSFIYALTLLCAFSLFFVTLFPQTAFAECYYADGGVAPCGTFPDQAIVPGTSSGAPSGTGSGTNAPSGSGSGTSLPSGSGSGTVQGRGEITNPLSGINSVSDFIQRLLRAVVQIGVPIAVLFIILSGFKFIMAQGNTEELATARRNFVHVVIGVAIFIGAWALAELIVATLRSIGINV